MHHFAKTSFPVGAWGYLQRVFANVLRSNLAGFVSFDTQTYRPCSPGTVLWVGLGGGREVCCECGGVLVWRFPASFCGNDGRVEAVAGRGVLSCICLAPQLVCGCSTRASLAFVLPCVGWVETAWRLCGFLVQNGAGNDV